MSFRDRYTAAVLSVLLLTGTAACQSSPDPLPSPTGRVAGADCVDDPSGVTNVVFGQDIGAELSGLILGKGTTGVVFAHQNNGDACDWLPFGQELAGRGYRVLLFDFAGFGVSPSANVDVAKQVTSAVASLRATGATRVVLIGGSMGATATLAATATMTPPVTGVISFSAPAAFGGTSASAAMPSLAVPALLVAGRGDSQFARDAETLHRLAPAGKATLLIAESGEHGWALVTQGIGRADVREATFLFLAQHAAV